MQMPTTAGAVALRGATTDRDAFIVQKLRQQGAIILGKANLSEWANFMTEESINGFSALGSYTRNPYGRFDVGGSSSGSAAAIAARFAVASVGSETSGSIVNPASQNSLCGFKPSLGLLSRDRIVPITVKMDTAGPITRNVTDLAILLTAMADVDPNDPETARAAALSGADFTEYLDQTCLQGRRVGVVALQQVDRSGDEQLLQQAKSALHAAGAVPVDITIEKPEIDFTSILLYGIRHDLNDYLAAQGEHVALHSLEEIVEFNQQAPAERIPYGQSYFEESLSLPMTADEYGWLAAENRERAGNFIRQLLEEHGVELLLSLKTDMTSIYSAAGFPAVTIPAGYRKTGEPVGMTLVGDYLSDDKLTGAAYALEQAHPVRREPSLK
jgi:amidase